MGQLCIFKNAHFPDHLSAMIGVDVDAIRQQSLELDHKLSAAAEELSTLNQEVARAGQARREVLRALERASSRGCTAVLSSTRDRAQTLL